MKHPIRRRLLHDTSGNILMITGLAFLFLVGVGGAGYDLGRQQLVRQKLQQAADASALGGASQLGLSQTQREDTANILFQLNYPDNYLGVARPTPTVTVTDLAVQVTANATVDTSFVGNFNIETMGAKGSSIAQIRQTTNKIDLVMVMDNSGSMASEDVGVATFLDAGSGIRTRCINGWLTLFPWLPVYTPDPMDQDATRFCDLWEAATGPTRLNALRASAAQLIDTLLPAGNPQDHKVALISWDSTVVDTQAFTDDGSVAKAFLLNMYGRHWTDSTTGLSAANTLSGSFRTDAVHAVILMTDGENRPPPSSGQTRESMNAASLAVCSTLKAKPKTLVYTIMFGTEFDNIDETRQFLSDCANPPNGAGQPNENLYFFSAPDAAALDAAFQQIVGNLQDVRIVN